MDDLGKITHTPGPLTVKIVPSWWPDGKRNSGQYTDTDFKVLV